MNTLKPEITQEIIDRFHSEEIVPDEMKRDFHLWLLASGGSEAKESAMRGIWDNLPAEPGDNDHLQLDNIRHKLGGTGRKKGFNLKRTVFRAAAVLIPILLIAGGIFLFSNRETAATETQWAYFEVPYGETGEYYLADGTRVVLNAGSRLEYPVEFDGQSREVRLDGEAYFDVAHDSVRPFSVISDNLHTIVKGTEFNISAYHNERHECVTVVNGAVSVATRGDETHLLNPDNSLTHWIEEGSTAVRKVNVASAISWMKRGLVLEECTLEDIMWELQRGYNLKVVIDAAQLTDSSTYDLEFVDGEPFDYILDEIHSHVGLPYRLENRTLIVGSDLKNATELAVREKRGNLKRT